MTRVRRPPDPEHPTADSASNTEDTQDRRELLRSAGFWLAAMMAGCGAQGDREAASTTPTSTEIPPTPTEIPPTPTATQTEPRSTGGADSAYNLTGWWISESGGEWYLVHDGTTVDGYVEGEARCDPDDGWILAGDDELHLSMTGQLDGNRFEGTTEICYMGSEGWPCRGEVKWERLEYTLSEDRNTLRGNWYDSCNGRSYPTSLERKSET